MRLELAGRHPLLRCDLRLRELDDGWLVIDARRMTFAGPLDLAAIVAIAQTAAVKGASIALASPRDLAVASYLQRMDVFRRLPPGAEIDGTLPGEQRSDLGAALLEVCPISSDTVDDVVTRVGRIATANLDAQVGALVFAGMGELIDNAVSHGASDVGAYIAAQTYTGTTSGRPGMELAICDTGVGVLEHLRGNPQHSKVGSAPTALKCAMRPGVTGTAEDRGYGLDDLSRTTSRGGLARLVMRSGDGFATVSFRRNTRRDAYRLANVAIQGTWAWLRVRYP